MTNQLGKILLFVTSYEKCDVSKRQLILKSVTLYVKIRKSMFSHLFFEFIFLLAFTRGFARKFQNVLKLCLYFHVCSNFNMKFVFLRRIIKTLL
jgi:hypothetical protein